MIGHLIREATRADLPGLLALYRELRPNDPAMPDSEASSSWDHLLGSPGLLVIVAESGSSIASTCMLAIVPSIASGGRPFGVIEHVVTAKTLRRRGLARSVLEHALRLAWSRNCYKVILLSGADRTEAHRVYESVGFRGGVECGFVAKPLGPNHALNPYALSARRLA
jgi:ribosomal protein S18 acetylase RimI-like enzyme